MSYRIHSEVAQFDTSYKNKASLKIKGNNKTVKCQVGFFCQPIP
jgi:hypothetical protein